MANTLTQSVSQEANGTAPKRVLVQYLDDTQEPQQVIVDYDSLSEGDKTTFDNYKALCESKMI